MIKYKSPGQKHKGLIGSVSMAIFIVTTLCAIFFIEQFDPGSYLWFVTHVSATDDEVPLFKQFISVARFTVLLSLIFYFFLKYLFVSSSKRTLPEGFYTQNTWLDVDDHCLVMVHADELVFFDFDSKHARQIQVDYQHDATVEQLIAIASPERVRRIPFDEISELVSDHNSDVFSVTHKGDTYKVVFLNQAVKAHALEMVQLLLPENLQYHRNERTRFKVALPLMVIFFLITIAAYEIDIAPVKYILCFMALFILLPKLCAYLIEPTITETWSQAAPLP